MKLVKKMSCSWLECENDGCPYFRDSVAGKDPFPYTYGYMSR